MSVSIEYPSMGETYNYPEFGVYEYGVYPRTSVLAGRTRRTFLDSFPTLAEAKAAYPNADVGPSAYHYDSLADLPDEDGHTFTP